MQSGVSFAFFFLFFVVFSAIFKYARKLDVKLLSVPKMGEMF